MFYCQLMFLKKLVFNNSLKNYELRPNHYLSAPALSWDAVIPDPDMYLLSEKDMRGGASQISKKYNKANNNYLKSYDSKQKLKHTQTRILYMVMKWLSFFQQADSNRISIPTIFVKIVSECQELLA